MMNDWQSGVTDVLEIGIGDGANFKYYPRGIRVRWHRPPPLLPAFDAF